MYDIYSKNYVQLLMNYSNKTFVRYRFCDCLKIDLRTILFVIVYNYAICNWMTHNNTLILNK